LSFVVVLVASAALFPALAIGGAADQDAVQLSDVQQRAIGIRLETVQVAGSADLAATSGGGLLLQGHVVLPNTRQDLLLANVGGRVKSVRVNPGDTVTAGQVLAQLYSSEALGLQRAYLSARSQAQVSAARLQRDESLFGDGVIASSRLEATRMAQQQDAMALREQRQLLLLAGHGVKAIDALDSVEGMSPVLSVVATRSGRVLDIAARVGAQVDAGAPLFTLAPLDVLWVELQASREQASHMAIGDLVDVAGCSSRGRLVAVGAQLDAASQTIALRAQISGASGCIMPNQFVQARVSGARAGTALRSLPATALFHHDGRDSVFVAKAEGYRVVDVVVDRLQGKSVWLRQGPDVGAQVVTAGVAALKGRWRGLGAVGGG
jgi:multidrug efflux pump subunit AcrA (membrane-fusion protein)